MNSRRRRKIWAASLEFSDSRSACAQSECANTKSAMKDSIILADTWIHWEHWIICTLDHAECCQWVKPDTMLWLNPIFSLIMPSRPPMIRAENTGTKMWRSGLAIDSWHCIAAFISGSLGYRLVDHMTRMSRKGHKDSSVAHSFSDDKWLASEDSRLYPVTSTPFGFGLWTSSHHWLRSKGTSMSNFKWKHHSLLRWRGDNWSGQTQRNNKEYVLGLRRYLARRKWL